MYPGDARAKWPAGVMTDQRVLHYWDEDRAVGTHYLSHLPAMLDRRAAETRVPAADAMWDAFYVYGRGVTWEAPVPLPISWGYPILVTRDQLVRDLARLLEPH
jgi:hypothetical protein